MSEHVLKLFLEELSTVRLHCAHKSGGADCPGVVEVPVACAGRITTCPVCGNEFPREALEALVNAIVRLLKVHSVRVGFVIQEGSR